jgi:hypothetical protein
MNKSKNRIFYVQREYPHYIDEWNNEHVRSFLINKNLTSLLPIVVDMNGRVLHMMYSMCMDHPESMFDRLKADTPNEHPLNMSTYLRFLHEIKQYVPNLPDTKSNHASTICGIL